MKKPHLIFIPAPGAGHLIAAVEFSLRLLARDARLSATILVMDSPFPIPTPLHQTPSTSPTAPGQPRFIFLPPNSIRDDSINAFVCKFAASHSNQVRTAILSLQESSKDQHRFHLVVDMFCTAFIDVGNELGIPSYVFFTASAAFLALLIHLPADRSLFDESEPEMSIPGFQNPVPNSALPNFAFDASRYTAFMNHAKRFKQTKGLIINTFSELEPYAIKSIGEVPVYTVGPVLDLKRQAGPAARIDIMEWLDVQPESSVVFLCFGSMGAFSEDQVKEISVGLSRSGQRFLWSLRIKNTTGARRPVEYTNTELKSVLPVEYTNTELKSVLPVEFWGAVEEGRGLVCGWAPQVEILAHKAVGSFVSHCGWNSTLESLWFGKPIVVWPLYAEQRSNAFVLVKELGLAAGWLGCGSKPGDLVRGDEVERAIRSVMDTDNVVRSRTKEISEISRSTLLNGGSSFESMGCLIGKIIGDEL